MKLVRWVKPGQACKALKNRGSIIRKYSAKGHV